MTDGKVGEEMDRVRAEYASLAGFVGLALAEAPQAELFASWEGEEQDEPVERLDVTESDLDQLEFVYDQRHYVRVHRSQTVPTTGP